MLQLNKNKGFSRLIEDYIRTLFDERKVPKSMQERLWRQYYNTLSKGVDVGYSPNLETYNPQLAYRLKYDVAKFSAFKETAFRKELEGLLTKNGRILPWSDFKKEAQKVSGLYNVNWIRTEYNHTIATANMAGKWEDFQENKDLYPNLRYDAVNDERTRQKHKDWDGLVAPIDHPIWNTLYPPNDWGCRCDVIQTDEAISKDLPKVKIKKAFKHNPAISEKIFNEVPYEKTLNERSKKDAEKNLENFAEKADETILLKDDFFKKNYNNETYLSNDILNKFNQSTIKHYTDISGHYEYLNHYLRTNKLLPIATDENIGTKFITIWKNQLEKSLDKLPNYKGLTYRGTTLPKDVFEQWKIAFEKGTPVTDKAFLSTTINEDYVFNGSHFLNIKSKTGKRIDTYSLVQREEEVLFKPNTKFKITNIEINDAGNYIIDLDEL